jgi:hypothetical protein
VPSHDLLHNRLLGLDIASGRFSVVTGGSNNTASGFGACIMGGGAGVDPHLGHAEAQNDLPVQGLDNEKSEKFSRSVTI